MREGNDRNWADGRCSWEIGRRIKRGRGQKVGPIDRGVRRSIYVFA